MRPELEPITVEAALEMLDVWRTPPFCRTQFESVRVTGPVTRCVLFGFEAPRQYNIETEKARAMIRESANDGIFWCSNRHAILVTRADGERVDLHAKRAGSLEFDALIERIFST